MFGSERFPNSATIVAAAVLLLLPFVTSVTLSSQIAIFGIGALSVTFLLGSVGLLSFGQGLYFGIGAYMAGLLLRDAEFSLLPTLALATLVGFVVSAALAWLIVRREGVYFVMLTLAFAHMGFFAMLAMKNISGGENGLSGLPRSFSVAGLPIATPAAFYAVSAVGFVIAFLVVQRLNASPFGSLLRAIRENPRRCETMGYNVRTFRVAAFALAGAIAALGGAFHAAYLGFVPPTDIELEMSQRLLVMSIVGGVQSPVGALIGSAFYTLASEIFSELWARWMALIAILFIAIVLYLPGGLWGIGAYLKAFMKDKEADG